MRAVNKDVTEILDIQEKVQNNFNINIQYHIITLHVFTCDLILLIIKARVFRRDSLPTRSRRITGSGGESSSMLSVEGNAVQGRMLL
jgi:hypothetical protein